MGAEMLTAVVMRAIGRRKCGTCDLFCSGGWFDEEGLWHCEECYMSCILDVFAEEPPMPEASLLVKGLMYVARAPLVLGYVLGNGIWRVTKTVAIASVLGPVGVTGVTLVSLSGQATYYGTCVVVGTASVACRLLARAAIGSTTSSCSPDSNRAPSSKPQELQYMTQERFVEPWVVVVDAKRKTKAGQLRIGDPVEAFLRQDDRYEDRGANDQEASEESGWRKATIKECADDGRYVVQDIETEATQRLGKKCVRLDMSRLTVVA